MSARSPVLKCGKGPSGASSWFTPCQHGMRLPLPRSLTHSLFLLRCPRRRGRARPRDRRSAGAADAPAAGCTQRQRHGASEGLSMRSISNSLTVGFMHPPTFPFCFLCPSLVFTFVSQCWSWSKRIWHEKIYCSFLTGFLCDFALNLVRWWFLNLFLDCFCVEWEIEFVQIC